MSAEDQTLAGDVPTMVGPFAILGTLGGGGMGVVYRARGPHGEPAALKVMHERLDSQQAVQRFVREQQIRIDHPNVVRTLDAGLDEEGRPFLALELLEGETLEARLRRGPLPSADAVRLCLQACRGLAAVHAAGIVHRDVKPSNLFLCEDGTVKLLDFGVALMSFRETRLTNLGAIVGTPAYLSPEQASGRPVDARSDVWSLGAVLYETLAGHPPFERETALATVVAVLMEPVPPLAARARHVTPELAGVLDRCLEKDPSRRFGGAAELAAALDALDLRQEEATAATERPPPPEPLPEGEQRVVAVMFAEGVRDRAGVEAAVERHGGRALELAGGRMIGVFGGEGWEGDEARRAAFAAVEARGAALAVGVAAGSAARRGQGIGGAVLEAARRGAESQLGGVWVAPNLVRSLQGDVVLRQLARDQWEIVARAEATRSTVVEPSAPLFGRAAERAQLTTAAAAVAREERARVVRLSGPAGIGKTRLQTEAIKLVAGSGEYRTLLFGRAEPIDRDRALSLVAAIVARRADDLAAGARRPGLQPDVPLAERREAVLRLAEEASSPARAQELAAFLGELVGVPMPETLASRAAATDPRLMADRMRLAAQDYLDGRCARGPVALFLDDVQWADGASLEVLRGALDLLVDAPLLVVATQRTETTEAASGALFPPSLVTDLRLGGLEPGEVAALASAAAGDRVPERLVELLVERTAGNPFFVEQIVLELRDGGKLQTDPGGLPLPFSVEAAVQTRLDHLPPPEKEATKVASVIGRPFAESELQDLLGERTASLLRELRMRDVLVRQRLGDDEPRYAFRSDLVRDVAYRMLGPELRASLHRRLADTLGARTLADPEEVASHLEHGGEPARAAELLVSAALAAARRGDGPSVLRCSSRAFALGGEDHGSYALRMARAEALGFLGQREEQAMELALALEAVSTDVERARTLAQQGTLLARMGRNDDAQEALSRAVEAASASGDVDTYVLALARRAEALVFAGRAGEARGVVAEALETARQASSATRGLFEHARGAAEWYVGDLGEARNAFVSAVEHLLACGDVRRAASVSSNLADAYNRLGAYEQAEAALHEALAGCRRVGNRAMEGYTHLNLGYALMMSDRRQEALASLERAAGLAADTRNTHLAVAADVYRARCMLAVEEPVVVAALADDAASSAARAKLPGLEVSALVLAARALLEADQVEEAVARSELALRQRDELGGVEEDEAEVFITLARCLEAAGRGGEAEDVLRRGRAQIESRASKIQDSRWRERFLSLPSHDALRVV